MRRLACVLIVGALVAITAAPALAAPGDLDTSFSGDGRVLFAQAGVGVGVLPNGKVLAVGSDWLVRRYTSSGVLDTRYGGGDGKARADFELGAQQAIASVLQLDGRLVIVGLVHDGSEWRTAVARLMPNGSLDGSFSGDGRILRGRGGPTFVPSDVAVSSKGVIYVGGTAGDVVTDDSDFGVLAYRPNGSLERSFGSDGLSRVDFEVGDDQGSGVAVQADDRIMIAGGAERRDGYDAMAVARLRPSGDRDRSFSGDGRALVSWKRSRFVEVWGGSRASDVIVHTRTGSVYLGGSLTNNTDEEGGRFAVIARLDARGSVVMKWESPLGHWGWLNDVALAGRDVAAAGGVETSLNDCCGWTLFRVTPAGRTVFAVQEFMLDSEEQAGQADGVAFQGGRIYVTGSTADGGGLARFQA
jgi:uncharacterized delta-60 repeat protein